MMYDCNHFDTKMMRDMKLLMMVVKMMKDMLLISILRKQKVLLLVMIV